ncbi:hypothetical protein HK102_003320 [Quaeritorhiza haematococci]|nr:hypothetical protein HK102_003320 [Quaeritorhiza haematococci]
MSTINNRKPNKSKDDDPAAKSSKSKAATTKAGRGLCGSIILYLGVALILALSASYIITDTLTFGQKIPHWKKFLPIRVRPRKTLFLFGYQKQEKVFKTEDLNQYDGSDPSKPIYLAINLILCSSPNYSGKVYDVSAGRDYYGPDGGYHFFAGRDAARAYITGCFETHLTHDLRGLSEKEIESLSTWTEFYENHDKYFYVGRVEHEPLDDSVPIPEDCNKKS